MVYDVAFALVWADDGDTVDTKNEAYAFASCADCAAVAVGFQVVLIVGQTDVIVPENLSASANYNCVRCLTYALASQLVLTLDGPLSSDGMARLNALWQEIAAYGKDLRNQPLSEIQGRLSAYKEQIMAVIKADPSATPAGSAGTARRRAPRPRRGRSGATPGATQAAAPRPARGTGRRDAGRHGTQPRHRQGPGTAPDLHRQGSHAQPGGTGTDTGDRAGSHAGHGLTRPDRYCASGSLAWRRPAPGRRRR